MRALDCHLVGMQKSARASMRRACTCASLRQTEPSPGPLLKIAQVSIALQGAVLAGKGSIHTLSCLCRMQLPYSIQLPHAAGDGLLGASPGLDMATGKDH